MKKPADAVSGDEVARVEFDVSAGADETVVPSGFNEWRGRFEARLSEPARDGRANAELLEEVEKATDSETRLVGGASSTKKTVEVARAADEVLEALRDGLTDRR
jgi:uncharacterized protein (TIGR00251 family)